MEDKIQNNAKDSMSSNGQYYESLAAKLVSLVVNGKDLKYANGTIQSDDLYKPLVYWLRKTTETPLTGTALDSMKYFIVDGFNSLQFAAPTDN